MWILHWQLVDYNPSCRKWGDNAKCDCIFRSGTKNGMTWYYLFQRHIRLYWFHFSSNKTFSQSVKMGNKNWSKSNHLIYQSKFHSFCSTERESKSKAICHLSVCDKAWPFMIFHYGKTSLSFPLIHAILMVAEDILQTQILSWSLITEKLL